MCFGLSVPALASNTDEFGKVMPEDIINAINRERDAIFYSADKDVDISKVFMESSMNITIPKIDLGMVHITIPLTNSEDDEFIKQELREHGYTDDEIATMDLGDYINISNNWKLSDEIIVIAKELFPELADENLANWTNEMYTDYRYQVSCQKNLPNAAETAAFEARGITMEDANWLLKEIVPIKLILICI